MRKTLIALVLLASPALAETTEEKADRCGAQKGIVDLAVVQRGLGADAKAVEKDLTKGENAVDEKYAPSVSPLVEWVFTLPEEQLVPEVGEAFETSCLAY